MHRKRRLWLICVTLLLIVGLYLFARPVAHLVRSLAGDVNELEPLPAGVVDDASRLNQTTVEVWDAAADAGQREEQLRRLLARAAKENRRVSIAGARHTMGGHTIYSGGISINTLGWKEMELDAERQILHVASGALWKDVIEYLDARGFSPAVMQSNHSFSVGGSISVNCHGWQYNRPPIASTVEAFRIMLADGTMERCSRTENQELFSLALGGYGLFGVILDVELRVVPNARYRLRQYIVPLEESLATFDAHISDRPDVQMAYARMSIVPDRMLSDVIINALEEEPEGTIPPLSQPGIQDLRRAIFRGSADSDYGKELRWNSEVKLQPWISGKVFSRNQLLNESAEVFQNRSAATTDILHEYFLPRDHVAGFATRLKEILLQHRPNLLNITVRIVNRDDDTFLRYADQQMIALVLLFVQPRTAEAEEEMETLTQDLIDAALENRGRYYLPYRLHATPQQFERAYPQARDFFRLKRQYDPQEIFQNEFYRKYGEPGEQGA